MQLQPMYVYVSLLVAMVTAAGLTRGTAWSFGGPVSMPALHLSLFLSHGDPAYDDSNQYLHPYL